MIGKARMQKERHRAARTHTNLRGFMQPNAKFEETAEREKRMSDISGLRHSSKKITPLKSPFSAGFWNLWALCEGRTFCDND
jgi:hypothetical protein